MIIQMKRLTLIAHKDDEQELLGALQSISAVQVIENASVQQQDSLEKSEQRVAKLGDALKTLRPFTPKKGLLEAKPEFTVTELRQALQGGLTDSDEVEALNNRLSMLQSEIEKNKALIDALNPWENFPSEMSSLGNTKSVKFFAGLMAAADIVKLDEFQDILEYECYNEGVVRATIVACAVEEQKNVSNLLKTLQWTDVVFPKLSGTPMRAREQLLNQTRDLNHLKEECQTQLMRKADCSATIERAYDAAVIELDKAKAADELKRTSATFVLEGWVRNDQTEDVQKTVASVTDAYYLDFRDPEEDEIPPSVVRNNSFVTPFEQVTNLYSRPDPKGMDATPYMAPFYVLLFGLMLSDTGYGLILAVGCWLFIRLKKPTGMSGGFAKVLLWGGLSTIVWGVLVGTFFGLDFDVLFGTKDVFPLLVDPMSDPIGMLILCFGLGVLHILFGVGLKMKMSFSEGDWQTAIFDNLSWILIVCGLIVFAVPSALPSVPAVVGKIGICAAILGAGMILLFKGRQKKNVFSRTVSGLGELYQVTSYLSDILSYARLFALGIATGVIASVFNQLCAMLMSSPNIILKILGIIVAVALLIGLHLFNIGINTLGAFVHCARLQYVEFYGKFYQAGGKEFRPLGYRTPHVTLKDAN